MLVCIVFSPLTFASDDQAEVDTLYFSVVSSGSGGSSLGHAFLTFCPNQDFLKLSECRVVEYNLDINIGSYRNLFLEANILTKAFMYEAALFKVYEHGNAAIITEKYNERGQSINFYRLESHAVAVQEIYLDTVRERRERILNDFDDYEIDDNNCVTKAIDAINRHIHRAKIIKESGDFFDLDSWIYNFPIFVTDRLKESQLFDAVISISKKGWSSKVLK
jgi:hypothetical protein